jgi:hypothetical protein
MAEGDSFKDKSVFSSGLGTALRLNVDFDLLNEAYYLNNYSEVLKTLKIIYRDIWCMPSKIDKKTGEIEDNLIFKKSEALKIVCETEYNNCLVPQKNGSRIFIPTGKFLSSLDTFDRYLRTVAKEYGLYMIMEDDNSEVHPMVRKPSINFGSFKRY